MGGVEFHRGGATGAEAGPRRGRHSVKEMITRGFKIPRTFRAASQFKLQNKAQIQIAAVEGRLGRATEHVIRLCQDVVKCKARSIRVTL